MTDTADADLAFVFLAGHAIERFGTGYFLPADFPFPPTPNALRFNAMELNALVEATAGAKSRVIVLDGCRTPVEGQSESLRLAKDLEELSSGQRNWPNLLMA